MTTFATNFVFARYSAEVGKNNATPVKINNPRANHTTCESVSKISDSRPV
jgi:hypothetical protein